MAFNAGISIAESQTPGTFVITDTSTGADAGLTGRTVILTKPDGSVFATVPWAIAQATITLAILDKDMALNIKVNFASSAPLASPSTYTAQQIYAFTGYAENFYLGLTQKQQSNPVLIGDDGFYFNKAKMRVDMDSAVQAVNYGQNIFLAQSAIERYQNLINHYNLYFS